MNKKRWPSVFIIILVVIACILIQSSSKNDEEKNLIPFVELNDGINTWSVGTNPAGCFSALNENGERINFEKDVIPQKIIAIEKGYIVFGKELYERNVICYLFEGDKKIVIELPEYFDDFIFRNAILFNSNLENSLYFVCYNTVSYTNQLFRIDVLDGKYVFNPAFSIDLDFGDNNIDENVRMLVVNDSKQFHGNSGLYIMGTQYYYVYETWSPLYIQRMRYDNDGRLLYTYNKGDNTGYVYYAENENLYVLKELKNRTEEDQYYRANDYESVMVGFNNDKPFLKIINSPEGFLEMFKYTITNQANGGFMDFASNNYEARIPWSQCYYLNGMIDFLMPVYDRFEKINGFKQFRDDIERRVGIELHYIDKLIESEIELKTYRYAVGRQEQVYTLHSQRILQLFERYNAYSKDPIVFQAGKMLWNRATSFSGTVEQLCKAGKDDKNKVKENRYYLISKSNASIINNTSLPYNYMSAWSSATFVKQLFEGDVEKEFIEYGTDFMSILKESESFTDFDSDCEWPYFYGEPYYGWSEQPDRNLKFWEGQKYNADITYRTMDAMAILYMMKVSEGQFDIDTVQYIANGVKNGKLMSFANEALLDCGYEKNPVILDTDICMKNVVIFHPWNVQQAAWSYYQTMNHWLQK